jgi:anti-sigma factor RsiW
MMTCLTARKRLIQLEAGIVSQQDAVAAQEHCRQCPECRRILEQENGFRGILRDRIKEQLAPNSLREMVLSVLAADKRHAEKTPKENKLHEKKSFIVGVAGVLILLILSASYSFLSHRKVASPAPIVETLVQEHVSSKLKEHPFDLQTADVGMLEGWFAGRVDFAVRVPRLKDTTLQGGHLCIIAGKRTVSLTLSKRDIPISLYIMDRNIMDLSSLKQIADRGGRHFYKGDGKGCNLILWEERGLIYGVVSDMEEKELIGLITQS